MCRGSHSSLRKIALNEEMKDHIAQATRVQQKSRQIITALRLQNADADDDENSTFKRHDIYNVKTAIRRKSLKSLTSTQTLLKELERGS